MQRTSTRFFGCMWQQLSMPHLLTLRHLQSSKMRSRHLASRSSGKVPTKGTNKTTSTTTTTTMQRDTAPRPIMREDNMWKDPQQLDTKWLSPRDPRRYRPDFKQTEPHSLRKQFMRSPDERTRDAMGRDWEAAIQFNENRRRQALLAYQQRNQDKLDKQYSRNNSGRRTKSKYSSKNAKDRKVGPPYDKHDED
ncbi:uncharacterized protein LOC117793839 [Drosophila innubila]|uniref:uncharacterized protein LOC117793839 n=1 Tax=Drosophila innubila TaxID=198719 RepID=UPI00148D1EB7|nr:uncharacterized protein LOC117793839 [Drosophila innubila]